MNSNIFSSDVLILGAGPAGASAALFLAKKGIASTLVDKAFFPRDKICGDALSGKVVEVLKKLDPSIIDELQHSPIQIGSFGITFVAPGGKSLRVPFKKDFAQMKQAPGFVTKRIDFDNFLIDKVKSNPLITLKEGVEIRQFEKQKNGYLAISKKGEQFASKLILVADGNNSSFSKDIAGIQVTPIENCYGLRTYYKNVAGLDADNFIELHFLKELLPGYFWIFPLPNGEANVGLGIRSDKLSERKMNLPKVFDKLIQEHPALKDRFKDAEKIGGTKLCGLPLGSRIRPISGDSYLLLGDAAALIDPFTGEGIGNAMVCGMLAANQVAESITLNRFDAGFLKQYDAAVYDRLWAELSLSRRLQQLVNYPRLFNFVVNKALNNAKLRELISCMFEDINLRAELKKPSFYIQLLFN